MTSDLGVEIRERFPDHSPIHEDGNPMRELIENGIGPVFDDLLTKMYSNSDNRFLQLATGIMLDKLGKWFGVLRNNLNDDQYRSLIIAVRSANPTVAGIKGAISAILGIDASLIIITNVTQKTSISGSTFPVTVGDQFTGPFCTLSENPLNSTSVVSGYINISVPSGNDLTILESVVDNLVIATTDVSFSTY